MQATSKCSKSPSICECIQGHNRAYRKKRHTSTPKLNLQRGTSAQIVQGSLATSSTFGVKLNRCAAFRARSTVAVLFAVLLRSCSTTPAWYSLGFEAKTGHDQNGMPLHLCKDFTLAILHSGKGRAITYLHCHEYVMSHRCLCRA